MQGMKAKQHNVGIKQNLPTTGASISGHSVMLTADVALTLCHSLLYNNLRT